MGILDRIKGQLIDVIEWTDSSSNTMVHKYDMNGKEIMMGAQLTVRESQAAVFVNEGEIADVFGPGRYELSTSNMPILTALKSWKYGFNSPFKSDVYFVNTKQFLDRKWGTSNPVMMRDAEFGMIRVRAFGIYSFRVSDPVKFLKEVFGTAALFTVDGDVSLGTVNLAPEPKPTEGKVLDWTGTLASPATWRLVGEGMSSSGVNLRATEKAYWINPVGTLLIFR